MGIANVKIYSCTYHALNILKMYTLDTIMYAYWLVHIAYL